MTPQAARESPNFEPKADLRISDAVITTLFPHNVGLAHRLGRMRGTEFFRWGRHMSPNASKPFKI